VRLPEVWRTTPINLTLTGEKCSCGRLIFPPRDFCPKCGERVLPKGKKISEEIRMGKTFPPKISYGSKEKV